MKTMGQRIRYVRKQRMLTQDQLSKLTEGHISKFTLSRYEHDMSTPRRLKLSLLAKVLSVPVSYFTSTEAECSQLNFRIPVNQNADINMRMLEEKAKQHINHFLFLCASLHLQKSFTNPLADLIIHNEDEAEQAANLLRSIWNMGDSTIVSVYKQLERHGIIVLEDDLGSIDGLCTWADNVHPVMLLNNHEGLSVERRRFSACHELGHLLLNIPSCIDTLIVERLCNAFAGAFLFPSSTFIEEIGSQRTALTLDELIALKNEYGVSIASMVHRAKDLGIITDEHYNWFYNNIIHQNRFEEGWGHYPFEEQCRRFHKMEQNVTEQCYNIAHPENKQ